jgi:putative two-component system response regulator
MIGSSLGQSLGLRPEELVTLQRGGFLHDIGKISIPDNILFKQGPLSPEEWSVMQNHTIAGERICAGLRSLHPVLPIIRSHHERMNGTGYPDGLKGDEIPLLARVMQVADIFDALTSERPYKRPFSPESALEILRDEVKAGWRDPQVVEAFCDIFPLFKDPDSLSNCSLLALALAVGEKDAERSADLQAANQQGGVPLKAGVDLQPALVRLPDRR